MKVFCKNFIGAMLIAITAFIAGCKQEEGPVSGVVIKGGNCFADVNSEINLYVSYVENDAIDKSVIITLEIKNDSTGGAVLSSNEIHSGDTITLKTGSSYNGFLTVKASGGGSTAETIIGTKNGTVISKNDRPSGFATLGVNTVSMTNEIEVSTAADLKYYAGKGGYVIYVTNNIDMSEGMLPPAGSTSTTSTDALDSFVAKYSSYSTYAAWMEGETKNVGAGENAYAWKNTLMNRYKSIIQIGVASNTAIIGVGNVTVRGASFSLKSSNNIIMRNLTLQDAVDPFPEHQANDGWNSQHDCICIDSAKNIWIDHCTMEDTLSLGTGANGEKWQVYDGLCDMKANCTNITVSNCVFRNHDKTMLIGSSDTDGSADYRFITLAGNYWLNCGQRCPMVRNSRIHIMNNLYDRDGSAKYNSQTTINARAGSIICSENNIVAAGASAGSSSSTFDPSDYYPYMLQVKSSSDIIKNAGAGKLSVQR